MKNKLKDLLNKKISIIAGCALAILVTACIIVYMLSLRKDNDNTNTPYASVVPAPTVIYTATPTSTPVVTPPLISTKDSSKLPDDIKKQYLYSKAIKQIYQQEELP